MSCGTVFELNTGAKIPAVGLGTYRSKPEEVYDAVLKAIKTGYRHIDAAYIYGNEKEVGKAIRDSGVPREELFVTTKLWNTFHRPEDVQAGLQASLDNLQIDYLDLWLMHWPIAFVPGDSSIKPDQVQLDDTDFVDTYKAMEKLVGPKVRAIGVSNFSVPKLEKLLAETTVVPAANQVELHPYLPQRKLLDFCREKGIHVTAYCPLGSVDSPLMKDQKLLDLAKKYNASPAQMLISWGVKRGTSVIPKSVTPSRIEKNFHVVPLRDEDFNTLDSLVSDENPRRIVDPINFWGVSIF
ncbi:NADP-dependent oxidoreductase domain-containing protein [Radiomyces spectabilis]|uniref:NADP-dependent oxidoreductase domain-containing protein n=1 Tax=Radiomyces spectabilis TaxID=64574 RepID=UPI00221E52A4|nr:NADP-dependent oxidoreductase domain-containing protein [Radiomyces spectabilis]KAI8371743.1 NADP-dependent oxidoreductase domain-containing protein [Radiomyces spectabilis]